MFKRMKKSIVALIMLITMLAGTATAALANHEPDVDASGRDRNHPVSLTIDHRLRPNGTPVEGAVWSLYEVRVPNTLAGQAWDLTLEQAVANGWVSTTRAATGTTGPDGIVVLTPPNQGVFVARESTPGNDRLAPDFLVSLPNYVRGVNGAPGQWIYHETARPKLDDVPYFEGKVITGVDFVDENLIVDWRMDGLHLGLGLENLMCVMLEGCDCVMCEYCVVVDGVHRTGNRCECTCDPDGCCDVFISFVDEMDERLTLIDESIEVYFLCDDAGTRIDLVHDLHWVLYFCEDSNTFEVRITRAGILHIVGPSPYNLNLPGLLFVDFSTQVDSVPCDECVNFDPECSDCMNATLGRLQNEPLLRYGRNEIGRHPGANLYLFSIEILKVSTTLVCEESGYPLRLQGAVFGLFQASDMEGPADNRTPIEGRRPVQTRTTDADGIARFIQIPDYPVNVWYVYELVAPAGHVRATSAIRVVLDRESAIHYDNFVIELPVSNAPGFELPMTGGTGTILLTIIGALLLTGATIFFVASKRRRRV